METRLEGPPWPHGWAHASMPAMARTPSSDPLPLFLAGRATTTPHTLEVLNKYDGSPVARVCRAGPEELDQAIQAACAAAPAMAALATHRRRAILEHCVARLTEDAQELAQCLAAEGGKTQVDAQGEVARLIDTFRVAVAEVGQHAGEVLALDTSPRGAGMRGMWKRVPVGPVSFITPFNFPLNLVAHKVAPALAVGCPFILKPASATPMGALRIGAILAECDLPEGAFSILPCTRKDADPFATDERLRLLSFTGSAEVGWALKSRAGKKRVVLELGGNAAVVVDETADVAFAAERIVAGSFANAGQSCISVQRVYAQERQYDALRAAIVAATERLVVGDPRDPGTDVGPLIHPAEAQRVRDWIDEALAAGAKRLCGAHGEGACVVPTVLEGVPRDLPLYSEEVFGPVVMLEPFVAFEEALDRVNESRFGLQAGVFTQRLDRAHRAWDRLEVGAVVIGDVPSWRADSMPYGGVKDSGLGREGIRYAMEDMTEMRLLAIRDMAPDARANDQN